LRSASEPSGGHCMELAGLAPLRRVRVRVACRRRRVQSTCRPDAGALLLICPLWSMAAVPTAFAEGPRTMSAINGRRAERSRSTRPGLRVRDMSCTLRTRILPRCGSLRSQHGADYVYALSSPAMQIVSGAITCAHPRAPSAMLSTSLTCSHRRMTCPPRAVSVGSLASASGTRRMRSRCRRRCRV